MTIFRPRIGNSTVPGPFNPPAAIPPEPAADAALQCNGSADGPNPQQPEPSPAIRPPAPAEPGAATDRHADLVCLADIEPRPIDWLWPDRLACGTLAMLSGDPGSGKTWVALAIAAALSRGRVPSTDHTLQPCTVLYASAANGAAELIRPRFAQLDGDPARLILLRGVLTASAQPASLSLRDTPMLEDALEQNPGPPAHHRPLAQLPVGTRSPPCQRFRPRLRQPRPSGGKASLLYSPRSSSPQARPRTYLDRALRRSPHRIHRRQQSRCAHPACAGAGEIQLRLPRGFAGLPHRPHRRLLLDRTQSAHPGRSHDGPAHRRRSPQTQARRRVAAPISARG